MCLKKVTFCVVCQEYRLLAPAGAPIKTCQTRVSVQEIPCRQPECRRNETIFPWLTGSFRPSDIRRTCGWRGCSENCCRYDVIYNPCCGNRPSNVVYQVRKNPRPDRREALKSNLWRTSLQLCVSCHLSFSLITKDHEYFKWQGSNGAVYISLLI